MKKIKIVVSAVNLRSGGPLSVLNDCLKSLGGEGADQFDVYAIVHDEKLCEKYDNVKYIAYPDAATSYLKRLYYEYLYFNKLSQEIKPDVWFSLHDITPNVSCDFQVTYCHNPSPFYVPSIKEIFFDFKFFLFTVFYKNLYKFNIQSNKLLVVQQEWIRSEFKKIYAGEIVVAPPEVPLVDLGIASEGNKTLTRFVYPAFPRIFKNFELILEACQLLESKGIDGFEVLLTIDGQENIYSKKLLKKYGGLRTVKFIGLQTREKVFELYKDSDCLIFPSKLETFGLPIVEYKTTGKQILLSDLEYAKEALGDYNSVNFFDPESPEELAVLMESVIKGVIKMEGNKKIESNGLHAGNWLDLFEIIKNKL